MTGREIAALVPWSRVLEEVGVDPGRKGRTCCPVHGGDNVTSFSFSDGTGVAHCFACGWHGDKFSFLHSVLGWDFRQSLSHFAAMVGITLGKNHKSDSTAIAEKKTRQAALNNLIAHNRAWEVRKVAELADERQELIIDLPGYEAAYRQMERSPDLFNDEDRQFFIWGLSKSYDRLAAIEYLLDLLTLHEYAEKRFDWWEGEYLKMLDEENSQNV